MKKTILISIAILLLGNFASFAGVNETGKKVPLDPSVRYGVLDNGMTYYIRSNELPENRADFYIVFNVGAILENDNQDGLAHLTEHMAFNGTENFPKKGVLDFLERNRCCIRT